MDINTTFGGMDDFKKGMDKTGRVMPGRIYGAVVKSCSLVETRAKTYHLAGATLKTHTHRFQQSVKSIVRRLGNLVSGRVGSPAVQAAIHEYGGIIRPVKAKYLVFQIDGKWIRTKKVTMPKREWLSKSFNDVKTQIELIFGREIELSIG